MSCSTGVKPRNTVQKAILISQAMGPNLAKILCCQNKCFRMRGMVFCDARGGYTRFVLDVPRYTLNISRRRYYYRNST